jgi:hypothetical protein
MKLSTRTRSALPLCALVVLSVGLLFAPGAAGATATGKPVAWGCGVGADWRCSVPSGLSGVTAIAAGPHHSLALKSDGTVNAWGCGAGATFGQCSVPSDLSGVSAIAAGEAHSLALKSDGTVVAWGCGSGAGPAACTVPSDLSGVTAIAAGGAHSLALKSNGTVVAWGCGARPDSGQCTVPSDLSGVTDIAAGYFHSLALKSDGSIVAWGCGINWGQCIVPSDLSGVTAIAASVYQSLALRGDGAVVAWGCGVLGLYGQCTVPSGLSGVTAIAAGHSHSLALKSDGTVVAWGCGLDQNYGQCSVPSGVCDVTAIAAGYSHSLALAKACQTITFGALAGKTFGDADFAVSASASSGLPMSFSGSGSCTVSGAIVHITDAGSCTVTASQPGDSDYAAAPDASQSFAIAKAGQSITFGPLATMTYGDPDISVSATASSGLPVSFAASGHCTVTAATVHLTGAGSCTVMASQAGNANYNPASDVSRTFAIAKASQAITFDALESKTYGDPDFTVSATATSGLAVSVAASGSCTASGAIVHITGAGFCTVTASQPGDSDHAAAPDVSQSFAVARASQSITFGALANKTYGDADFTVSATASSGLAVSFAASGNCTASGATVHLTGAGSCTVTASQPGDADYNAAPDVSRIFLVRRVCRVPKVVGKRVASAKRTIAQRHCGTGKVGYAYSRKHKKGVVISQNRRPGTVLPARSKIDLIVSRGRRR